MSSITITYTADSIQLDEETLINGIALKVSKHFQELGVQVASVAQARCPVGEERGFNPKTSSFQGLRLKPIGTFGLVRGQNSKAERLLELHGFAPGRARARAVNTATDREFFQGTGKNKGKTPDLIEVQRGTIRGAFQHAPGTLRNSIKFVGVERRENRVVAVVRASAPYAMAVHDGFTHKGGSKHEGRATKIKGRPFLKQALVNIQSRLTNASAYEG